MKIKITLLMFLIVVTAPLFAQFKGGDGSGYSSGVYSDGPLPVELSSFTASVGDNSVSLNWITDSEVNNYGFEIQKKSEKNNIWNTIGFVEGKGNSNNRSIYSYTDNLSESGNFKYRLNQIDIDGKNSFSDEVYVTVGIPSSTDLAQNYPNPFNPSTTIGFTLNKQSFVQLTVYNIIGEQVALLINEQKEAGSYNIKFNASSLNSGIYLYKLKAGDVVKVNKMQLIK